jgi:hypothetical protein
MNGHVFQCSEEQTDRMQFKNTKEALQAYVKKTLQHPEDMAPLFATTMATPTLTMPMEPGPNPSRTDKMIYGEKVKQFVKRESFLEGNMSTVHGSRCGLGPVQQGHEGQGQVSEGLPNQDRCKRLPMAFGIHQGCNP